MTHPPQRSARAFNDMAELVDAIWPGPLGGSKRGFVVAPEGMRNAAAVSLASDTSNQSPFGAAKDAVSLAAATRYRFQGNIDLDNGAVSHTTLFGFLATGGLTLTSAKIWVIASSPATANAIAAAQITQLDAITPAAVTAASTALSTQLIVRGELVTLAAGLLTPVIAFGTAPTGTNEGAIGSFFEIWRAGASGDTVFGNVA